MSALRIRLFLSFFAAVVVAVLSAGCSDLAKAPTTPTPPDPVAGFRVTSAVSGVDNASFSGSCPRRFTFTGTITTSEAGSVTYKWERSDGSATPTATLSFSGSGAQTVTTAWDMGTSGNGWQRLHVLTPNDTLSNQATFNLSCSTAGVVSSATVAVDPSSFTGPCPHTFNFTGTITATAAGTVTYRWERSDGSASAAQTMNFTTAGSLSSTTTWDVSGGGSGWMRLHVLTPNDLTSSQAPITLTCQ